MSNDTIAAAWFDHLKRDTHNHVLSALGVGPIAKERQP